MPSNRRRQGEKRLKGRFGKCARIPWRLLHLEEEGWGEKEAYPRGGVLGAGQLNRSGEDLRKRNMSPWGKKREQ